MLIDLPYGLTLLKGITDVDHWDAWAYPTDKIHPLINAIKLCNKSDHFVVVLFCEHSHAASYM